MFTKIDSMRTLTKRPNLLRRQVAKRFGRSRPQPDASHCLNSRRIRCRQRGAAAVEAALLMPLLVLIVLGAIDIGQFANVTQSVSSAAGVGSRMACRNSTTDTAAVESAVFAYLAQTFPAVDPSILNQAIQVSVTHEDGTAIQNGDLSSVSAGEKIRVSISLDYSAVRWMGAIDYWQLNISPVRSYGRRE